MSTRELVVLGTSSAVPTRRRNHNGYLLRWGAHGVLFDPGEGTQRQLRYAGQAVSDITRICVTHFHGDHCLGLPGVIQRLARDQVSHEVRVSYPAAGEVYWRRLRHASAFGDTATVTAEPVAGEEAVLCAPWEAGEFSITARPLQHRIPTYGYRLAEPDGRRMLPDRLVAHGISGPDVGHLQREGVIETARGRRVRLEECSARRRGQVFAFVMDTADCANALALAEGADMLVIESTYLEAEQALAAAYRHLTASQAGRIAARAGVRALVLTHISERYEASSDERFIDEAAQHFDGEIVLANDLDRVALPTRR